MGHEEKASCNGVAESTPRMYPNIQISEEYTVTEEPMGSIRPVRIVAIGAGVSGINLAYQVQQRMKKTDLVIYEKNSAVGGTWYENRYPGCKCDIPSHNYQFSWEPNPDWSGMWSPAPEIRAYLDHCVTKHKLQDYIKLNHRVIGAAWNEQNHIWNITVQDETTNTVIRDSCDFLVNATGILNNWKWPDIKGLFDFKGKLVHSANWPQNWEYKDLRVAVLGNGSSGMQIVPSMQPDVKELIHLVRSPTWVTPAPPTRYAALLGRPIPEKFPDEDKWMFREDPEAYLNFRMQIERGINARFPLLLNGSDTQKTAIEAAQESMRSLLGSGVGAQHADSIIPDFPVGCRRITPGVGYLESFSRPNVRVITNVKISHVTSTGIVLEDGDEIEVDAIVTATGFDLSFVPRFPIIGRDNTSMSDLWSEPNIPYTYLSTCVPKFPNYFVILGPNAPIAHGSVLAVTEQCSKYILQLITKAQTEGILAYEVSQEACNDFQTHLSHFMPRTTWAANCRSWFKGGKAQGPVTAIHPGSRVHWFHMMERPRFEDFTYTYETQNRFQYLGNGFSRREVCEDDDSTWFLTDSNWDLLYY